MSTSPPTPPPTQPPTPPSTPPGPTPSGPVPAAQAPNTTQPHAAAEMPGRKSRFFSQVTERINWLTVLITTALALLGTGAAAEVYWQKVVKTDQLEKAVHDILEQHLKAGHPEIYQLQRQMERVEGKLDVLLTRTDNRSRPTPDTSSSASGYGEQEPPVPTKKRRVRREAAPSPSPAPLKEVKP